ncbi:hypothetical protein VS872_22590, partial [Salmonella enterica subsp. enterica serovar Paratyphi A]|nr:hypothetical protein [Salmonella enterica subsp. enterica serovar Paratyphi A]
AVPAFWFSTPSATSSIIQSLPQRDNNIRSPFELTASVPMAVPAFWFSTPSATSSIIQSLPQRDNNIRSPFEL